MAERKKLTITEVKEREKVGANNIPKLSFKAKDDAGKELWYFTFAKSLFETIEAKGEIDCEVEIKEREVEGNIYVDRKVSQIYVDGKPIGGDKQRDYGRQLSSGDRASIEQQVAAKIGGVLLASQIITIEDSLGKLTIAWCETRLKSETKKEEAKTKISPTVEKPQTSETKPEPAPPDRLEKTEEFTTEELFSRVAEAKGWKSAKTARSWLVNGPLKIVEQRIDNEPKAVWDEIKALI